MSKFIKIFLVYILLYAVLVAAFVHNGYISQNLMAVTKEIFWFGFVCVLAIKYRKLLGQYIANIYVYYLVLLLMIWIWICVTLVMQNHDPEIYQNMIIGLKYGVLFMAIMLSASFVWYIYKSKEENYQELVWSILQIVIISLAIGLVWQWAKFVRPEFFMKYLWFGPIGDYDVGNPPLYYRTWPGGFPRYNWFFAGPNNLWFLLVLLWSVAIFSKSLWIKIWQKVLYVVVCILVLSRGLIVGVILQSVIYFYLNAWFRKYMIRVWAVLILAIIWLSIYKRQSTLDHLSLSLWSLSKFTSNIYGYGLGSSGPAVHRHGKILPENFYLQILIDFGLFGFLTFVARWWIYIKRSLQLIKSDYIFLLLSLWLIGVFVEWLFLHVREDSMVNYIFMVLYGIARGHNLRKN